MYALSRDLRGHFGVGSWILLLSLNGLWGDSSSPVSRAPSAPPEQPGAEPGAGPGRSASASGRAEGGQPEAARQENYIRALAEGRELHRRGDYAGAIRAFREALRLSPGDPQVQSELGWSAFMNGDLGLAEQSTTQAIGQTTDVNLSGSLYYNLGRIYEARGRLEMAYRFYRHSITLRPYNKAVMARFRDVYRMMHPSEEPGQPASRGPRLTLKPVVTPIAPVAILVTADLQPGANADSVEAERRTSGSLDPEKYNIPNLLHEAGAHLRKVDRSEPDTVYTYRIRVRPDDRPVQDWLPEITVRTPSAPQRPPDPPADAKSSGVSPFAIEISWRDQSDNEYGFVVERKLSGGDYARIAFVDPNRTHYVEHGLLPGTRAGYRIRSFNPRGASQASGEAMAVTLPLEGWDAVGAALRMGQRPSPGCCTSRNDLLDRSQPAKPSAGESGTEDEENPEGPIAPEIASLDLGNGHVLDAQIDSESCGRVCEWRLYGTYAGCYRELGHLTVPAGSTGPDILSPTRSGWPILRTREHMSAWESQVELLMMVNGYYVEVDTFASCPDGGPGTEPQEVDDPTKSRPPYSDCQMH